MKNYKLICSVVIGLFCILTLGCTDKEAEAEARRTQGNTYYDNKQYDMAIAEYTRAISVVPKDAIAYNNRGNSYLNMKRYDMAIADYNQAIKFDPRLPNPYNGRGDAYKGKGEYDKAIVDYTQSFSVDPNFTLAKQNLARLEQEIAAQKSANFFQPYIDNAWNAAVERQRQKVERESRQGR